MKLGTMNAKQKELLKPWKDSLLRIKFFDDDKCLDTSISQSEVQNDQPVVLSMDCLVIQMKK